MIEKRRKLIFFWPYLVWGGAQIYFLAIIKEAIDEWDITVVFPRASSPEMIRFVDQTGAKIEFLEFYQDLQIANSLSDKLRRQMHRIQIEIESFRFLRRYNLRESILHIEFPPWQSWIFFTALAIRRANVFVTMHNALPDKQPAWRVAVWKARLHFLSRLPGFHIFTSNEDTRNKLRGWVAEKFWQKMRVTYTCVNPPEIENIVATKDPAEIREKFRIDKDKFVVLCVGQFIDRKGRWVFLDAAKTVVKEHDDVMFVWLSPKLPTDDEQKRIDEYKLGEKFKFVLSETVGSTHEDVLRFFCIADIFALASFVEGLPIALLEAMALGIPSISTNVYAIPEAVKHLETGLLIEAGDSSAFADAIIRLKDDADLRAQLARQGSEFVLNNFDERVASRRAISAYKECFRA